MRRADSFEKTLMLGKIEGGRRRGRQRMRQLDGITDSMDMSLSKLQEQTPGDSEGQGSLACCSPWGHKESDAIEQLNTTTKSPKLSIIKFTRVPYRKFGKQTNTMKLYVWSLFSKNLHYPFVIFLSSSFSPGMICFVCCSCDCRF